MLRALLRCRYAESLCAQPACLPAWRSVQTAKRKYRHTLEAMHNGTLGQEKGEEGGCRAPWLPSIVFQSVSIAAVSLGAAEAMLLLRCVD
jgi:hypothetical protein